jgi:division protein CdvB (Snf7/Vps24/ESCRT-III family)
MTMTNYDVLFMHDHFVLVTTIIIDETDDEEAIELAALKRLADEYGDEFMEIIKSSKQVTIESVPGTSVPVPGDPEDAGIER